MPSSAAPSAGARARGGTRRGPRWGGGGWGGAPPPAPAEDQNGFAVTTAFGAQHGVGRLSDLKALAPGLTFGGPPDCPDRPYCLPGLEQVYGLTFGKVVAMPSRAATVQQLITGQIDVGLLETTDAQLAVAPIMLLVDDGHLQPPVNAVPRVRHNRL